MTAQQPAPEQPEAARPVAQGATVEAVEALARALHADESERGYAPDAYEEAADWYESNAAAALTFLRDAIHGDGPESDAIRDALGLGVTEEHGTYDEYGWMSEGEYLIPSEDCTHVRRRVIGVDWREVER